MTGVTPPVKPEDPHDVIVGMWSMAIQAEMSKQMMQEDWIVNGQIYVNAHQAYLEQQQQAQQQAAMQGMGGGDQVGLGPEGNPVSRESEQVMADQQGLG